MQVTALAIADVKLLTPKVFGDDRGFFVETYNRDTFAKLGFSDIYVQDNHSLSRPVGVVRGLHYQLMPRAQAKLVRVLRGSIFDVAVDLRAASPTFGRHVSAVLSGDNKQLLYVPVGFAHGFVTLEPDTEVAYKVTDTYAPDCDRAVRWDDADLAIDWPVERAIVTVSDKDGRAPPFRGIGRPFE